MIRKVNKKEKIETAGIIILCLYAILFSALFINTSLDIKDFTGFVVGGIKENIADSLLNPDETYGDISANLTIIDDTDIKVKALNEEVKFYARYVDINTGKAIKDALCTIYFYDINHSTRVDEITIR